LEEIKVEKKVIAIYPYNKGYMVVTYENEQGQWQEVKERE